MKKVISIICFLLVVGSVFATEWTLKYFVDEFGDPTNEKYIMTTMNIKYGSYSWEEKYCGILIDYKGKVSFNIGKTYYDDWFIKIKTSDGQTKTFKGEMTKYTADRIYLSSTKDNDILISAMKEGCRILLIPDNMYADSKYDFGTIMVTEKDLSFLNKTEEVISTTKTTTNTVEEDINDKWFSITFQQRNALTKAYADFTDCIENDKYIINARNTLYSLIVTYLGTDYSDKYILRHFPLYWEYKNNL